jgi:hypothetical protein
LLLVCPDVVHQNNLVFRLARIDPDRRESGNVLLGEAALVGQDSGDEQIFDRNHGSRKRLFEQTLGHPGGENVSEKTVDFKFKIYHLPFSHNCQ